MENFDKISEKKESLRDIELVETPIEATDEEADDKKCSKNCCTPKCCLGFLRRNLLLLMLIASLVIGIVVGVGMRGLDPPLDSREQIYFKFPGDLLMRMLKALVIPLIVSSLISGVAGLDTAASSKMGLYAMIYYMSTTFSAVLLGILLVCTIKPGVNSAVESTGSMETANVVDSFLDLIRNMFPDNIVEACFRQTKTYQVPKNVTEYFNTTLYDNDTYVLNSTTHVAYSSDVRKEDGVNVLGLVVFSIALGIVLGRLGEIGKPFVRMCYALAEAMMILVTAVIWYSPFGIVFLIASEIIKMKDPLAELQSLGLYMVTVLSGLFIHGCIILPLIYLVIVRRNPFKFLSHALQAFLTAFGTASSSATLPVTYHCLEEKASIDRRVTRFLLPVGATINMDGTALYEAVAAIFIAQSNGLQLNPAQIVATSITATLASIGAASVPQAGLVTMIIVLSAIGLPADEVTKILAVDWLLDRFRTTVNVEGDCIGSGVVAHLCRRDLEESQAVLDESNELSDALSSSPPSYSNNNADIANITETTPKNEGNTNHRCANDDVSDIVDVSKF